MTAERDHAVLSASGAHRWIRCTPAARLEESLPEEKSEFADAGSLAHELASLKLEKKFAVLKPSAYKNRLAAIKAKPLYQAEMEGMTDIYIDYIMSLVHSYSIKPYLAIEQKVDYSHVAPEGFGTADCIIISGSTLHVIDFKYGKGVPVSAIENEQMMLYSLGAVARYSMIYDIVEIKMEIVQPRLDSISKWGLTAPELRAWAEQIKPISAKAFMGVGDYSPGEKQCKFCSAKGICRARADNSLKLSGYGKSLPPVLNNEEIGKILQEALDLADWAKKLEAVAIKKILDNESIPGWKVVEGRSNRAIQNIDEAFGVLKNNGFAEAVLYIQKPATLTELEVLVGKKKLAELLSNYIFKPTGKPTIASETDPREPFKQLSAKEEFGGKENDTTIE